MPEVLPLTASRKDLRLSFDKIVKSADRATIAALNRTADRALTLAVRGMQAELGASSQKSIRRYTSVDRASSNRAVAYLEVRGQRIPLIEFGARQTKKGVAYKGQGGVRKVISGAFLAVMPSGHKGVFKRRFGSRAGGSSRLVGPVRWKDIRLPIDERFGPSASKSFAQESVQTPIRAFLRDFFPQEFKRLLNLRIAG